MLINSEIVSKGHIFDGFFAKPHITDIVTEEMVYRKVRLDTALAGIYESIKGGLNSAAEGVGNFLQRGFNFVTGNGFNTNQEIAVNAAMEYYNNNNYNTAHASDEYLQQAALQAAYDYKFDEDMKNGKGILLAENNGNGSRMSDTSSLSDIYVSKYLSAQQNGNENNPLLSYDREKDPLNPNREVNKDVLDRINGKETVKDEESMNAKVLEKRIVPGIIRNSGIYQAEKTTIEGLYDSLKTNSENQSKIDSRDMTNKELKQRVDYDFGKTFGTVDTRTNEDIAKSTILNTINNTEMEALKTFINNDIVNPLDFGIGLLSSSAATVYITNYLSTGGDYNIPLPLPSFKIINDDSSFVKFNGKINFGRDHIYQNGIKTNGTKNYWNTTVGATYYYSIGD